jgi:SAM-dependent methyltransferase
MYREMPAAGGGFNYCVGDQTHVVGAQLLMCMIGRPKGVLGLLGGVIMARVNRDAAGQVIDVLDVRPDDNVLEVGFGPGVAIQLLLHRVPAGSVAGVDRSREMVRQAAARNADAWRSRRVDLRYGSVERLPFADEMFDKAFAINSMQMWPDARAGGDAARAQTWWQRRARLHGQLRSAKRGRRRGARRGWLCAGANRGQVEALLCDRDKTVMGTRAVPPSNEECVPEQFRLWFGTSLNDRNSGECGTHLDGSPIGDFVLKPSSAI